MKLLLDQGLAYRACALLASRSINAIHVRDLGLSSATDEEILDAARQHAAVVVTLDSDFHRILAEHKLAAPSVIRIRIDSLKADAVAMLLEKVLMGIGSELDAGAVVSVTRGRVPVRKLPLHI